MRIYPMNKTRPLYGQDGKPVDPEEGIEVENEYDPFWLRRIKDGEAKRGDPKEETPAASEKREEQAPAEASESVPLAPPAAAAPALANPAPVETGGRTKRNPERS